jgi:hypothetical protein
VCELVDGDARPKDVRYCSWCDAYLCDRCRPNFGRRTLAVFLEATKGAA